MTSRAQQMVTYDTTFGGWNAIVTEDVALQGTDSAAGIVFFPGIGQMTTKLSDLSVNGPHYLINNGLWDGSVTLGNGLHHPFIISLQPPSSGYSATAVLPKIQAILSRYRIKRNSFYLTGLSCGGWQANEFVAYQPTPGDNSYGRLVKAIVNLEGVEPADSTGGYASESYPRKMGHWARACGGRELWVEGSNDWRDMLAGAQNMADSVPGSASYFMVTYGGGAHCCWNTEYQPSVTWTTASNANISQVFGAQLPMNVWQWLLRQGDTTMPAGESGTKIFTLVAPPTVSAGKGQTINLPASSVSVTGTATGNGGATIAALNWKQETGPVTATIGSPYSLNTSITGMTVTGSYVFKLTATDSRGQTGNGSMTVTIGVATQAPTVSAGKGQTISLPSTSVIVNGTATGNGGAYLVALNWKQETGPVTATIGSPYSLSTSITGMTVAGSYIFKLTGTDNKGQTGNGSMTVTILPGASTTAIANGATTVADDSLAMTNPPATSPGTGTELYPDPVRDLLNIRLTNGSTGKLSLAVLNMKGERVRDLELDKQSPMIESAIDVGRLPAGLYILEIITGDGRRTARKFVRQ